MNAQVTQDVLRHIQSLPPLPIAVQRLLAVADDPDVNISELTQIIEKDQALTAHILRVANSSFYGLSRRVETISKAVVVLGFHTLRNIALRVAVLGLKRRTDGQHQPHQEALWKHALAVACAAQLLAKRLRLADPEVAFVAGLLHDLGKIVLVEVLGERYVGLLEQAEGSTAPLHVREQVVFGITHEAAGRVLCEYWQIPTLLTRVVAAHHSQEGVEATAPSEDPLIDTVRMANATAKIAQIGSSGNPYVALDSLDGSRARAFQGSWREVLDVLPAKVQAIEAAFFDGGSAEASAPSSQENSLFPVGLYLKRPEARDMVTLVLREHGCSAASVEELLSEDAGLIGVVTDGTVPAALEGHLAQQGLPLLNLSSWQGGRAHGSGFSINIQRLQTWIPQVTRNAQRVL